MTTSQATNFKTSEKNMTIIDELDSVMDLVGENLGQDEKEVSEREKLKKIDSMYIVSKKDDDSIFSFGDLKYTKSKQKTNADNVYAPLVS